MSAYEIKEFAFSTDVEPLAVLDASGPIAALARFAVGEGFSDPRTYGDFFFTAKDGRIGMVFTNTCLFAEKVS